jgi:transposase
MSKRRRAYPPEFQRQIVELVRSGRNPEELSREFEPTAQAIRNWVAQTDREMSLTSRRTLSPGWPRPSPR